ncbi:CBS domain-containing protein CBSX6-like isoform X1 [Zingiber officinale]|uniref:CBS domain-containing protein CBSX6-like isoform X1 n=1 Tax=Zingiber officinale TaxID=94328 RepID=UPI001C4B5A51|nr:CBS domain-containing protein CBSX6-like isoform X1 [Zingiber officinale]
MAFVFHNHAAGDLTLGKTELVEFSEAETLEAAVRAIAASPEATIPVWRKRSPAEDAAGIPCSDRFLGMINSLEVAAFLARTGGDHDRAMRTPVSEVVTPNPSLLKEVDPRVRLVDVLEVMKTGVRCLLVRKSSGGLESIATKASDNARPSTSSSSHHDDRFCCLSREDVVRFLIGHLGALAPIPLSSISSLGAFSPHYSHIEASSPAMRAIAKMPNDPCAIAVVETNPDGTHRILGDISAYKLWKCDCPAAAWALRCLSAGQFGMGVEDGDSSRAEDASNGGAGGRPRSMRWGASKPLRCKDTSSLAAVMAQMLSHRATHVWVVDAESEDDTLVGVVSYADILDAVARYPTIMRPRNI